MSIGEGRGVHTRSLSSTEARPTPTLEPSSIGTVWCLGGKAVRRQMLQLGTVPRMVSRYPRLAQGPAIIRGSTRPPTNPLDCVNR